MKAFLCCLLIFNGICVVYGQTAPPDSGPSFASADTSKAEVISATSTQDYPTGSGHQSSLANDPHATQDSGPIRDWSNPPGFLGYVHGYVATSKRRPLEAKKYQRIKSYRCYSF